MISQYFEIRTTYRTESPSIHIKSMPFMILPHNGVRFFRRRVFKRYSWNIETEILRRMKKSLVKTQIYEYKNSPLERICPHCVLCKFRNLMCVSNFPSVRQKQTSLCCSNLQIKILLSWKFYNASFCWPVLWPFFLFPYPLSYKANKKLLSPGRFTVRIQLNYFGKYRVHNSAMSQNNSLTIDSGSLKKIYFI